MIALLNKIESSLIDILFKNAGNIKTMYIDYHKPYVSRIWFIDEENDCRIFLHKIEPCNESKEALYHPHKWDSAVRIIAGEYEMGVGHSATDQIPKTDCVLILGRNACYSMTEKDGWHYVSPKKPTYTLMVIPNKLNGRKMPIEPEKKFRKLHRKEIEDIFYTFRENKYAGLSVETLVDLIKDEDEVVIKKATNPKSEDFKRGDKVNFKGDGKYAPMKGTYVWAVNVHMFLMYYIEHPDGDITKELVAHNGGLQDGFETVHSRNFKEGLKYICVMPEHLEKTV